MMGDGLMCVWQTIFAQTLAKGQDTDFAQELKSITIQLLTALNTKEFSEDEFSTVLKHGYASFQDFKVYIMKQIQDDDVPDYLQIAEIEDECWKLSKHVYKSALSEKSLKKIWKIANRLTLVNSYPPIICKEEMELVTEKVVDYVSCTGNKRVLPDDATFTEFLEYLEKELFKNSSEDKVRECIDDLHCWLVWEVYRTGWVYKRAKTGPNWTKWVKRWLALVPGRLLFYDKESVTLDDKPKSEVVITDCTKIISQDPYKGTCFKLDGRFKVVNPPLSECEIATNAIEKSNVWVKEIQQQIKCADTPMQKLLLERYQIREEHKRKTKDNTNQLSKYLGTNKGARQFNALEENDNEIATEEAKMKAMYMKLDLDGNGYIDKTEFAKYINNLGLKMKENEINLIFHQIDTNSNGLIDFNEFCEYFSEQILDEQGASEDINAFRGAFLAADRDGSGTINFKEFSDYIWGKKRDIRMNNLLKAFNRFETSGDEELSFSEFKKLMDKEELEFGKISANELSGESSGLSAFEKQIQKTFKATEFDDLAAFLNERWKSFAAFKRQGRSGTLVMTGSEEMVSDVLPGNYNLVDLVCFSDLPPLEPKRTVIKDIKWISNKVPGRSGRVIFPDSFDGKIAKEFATNEHLRYYGACFAENQQVKVSLCYRHGIQDFTYENTYLEDFAKVRGCGIETHSFAHLDCPLDANNGFFVLGKLIGDELHLTAFQVPVRHTLYVPPDTIHSNDYLIGTWRTMLSDEAVIDHVFTVREKKYGENVLYERFQLTFE